MIKMMLFDWNNTLADDFKIWWESVQKTFRVFGKQPPTVREYFEGLKTDYLDLYRGCGITASRRKLNAIYESCYGGHIGEVTLFPGVKKTLEFFWRQKIILGLVTQQKDFMVFPVLKKFGLDNLFGHCECHALSKTEAICRILRETEIYFDECCFVGDAPSDINSGNRIGIVTVAFLNGNVPKDLVMAAEPHFTITEFGRLRKVIKGA